MGHTSTSCAPGRQRDGERHPDPERAPAGHPGAFPESSKTRVTKEHLTGGVPMNASIPSSLDSTALARRLGELAGEEREVQVDFLLHLAEFDQRRAYLEAGFGSLWEYCLKALHLREGAAGRRIAAMRVLRQFPKLQPTLRDGRLCLSTLSLLGQVLTEENAEDLLARAAYKTKAEVEHLVATIRPREAPRDGIRKLPESSRSGGGMTLALRSDEPAG